MREESNSIGQMNEEITKDTVIDGRFVVIEVLGSGGFGTVYKAAQRHLDRIVAIKLLNLSGPVSTETKSRFNQEALALAKLNHPGIPSLYQFGFWGETPYIVMEFLEGRTLRQLLDQEHRLPWRRAVGIIMQACNAVGAAHERGIIHRDLKSTNLMISGLEDSIKVIDFGLVKLTGRTEQRLTQTGAVIGSVYYMSPEQCQGRPVDHRCDIYSLACVLYEALTGAPPFNGGNQLAVISKHVHESPLPLKEVLSGSDIPEALDFILSRAMAKMVENRYNSIRDFSHDLDALFNDESTKILAMKETTTRSSSRLNGKIKSFEGISVVLIVLSVWWLLCDKSLEQRNLPFSAKTSKTSGDLVLAPGSPRSSSTDKAFAANWSNVMKEMIAASGSTEEQNKLAEALLTLIRNNHAENIPPQDIYLVYAACKQRLLPMSPQFISLTKECLESLKHTRDDEFIFKATIDQIRVTYSNRFAECEHLYREAISDYSSIAPETEGRAYLEVAWCCEHRDGRAAIADYKKALDCFKECRDFRGCLKASEKILLLSSILKDHPTAQMARKDVEHYANKLNASESVVLLEELALDLQNRDLSQLSMEIHREIEMHAKQSGIGRLIFRAVVGSAEALVEQGRFSRAEEKIREAFSIDAQERTPEMETAAFTVLTSCAMHQDDLNKRMADLARARKFFATRKDFSASLSISSKILLTACMLRDKQMMNEARRDFFSLVDKVDPMEGVKRLQSLAANSSLKDEERLGILKAIALVSRKTRDRQLIVDSLVKYGDALINDQARWGEALQPLQEALSLPDGEIATITTGLAYLDIGLWHEKRKQIREACINYRKSLEYFRKCHNDLRCLEASAHTMMLSLLLNDRAGADQAGCDVSKYAERVEPLTAVQCLKSLGDLLAANGLSYSKRTDILEQIALTSKRTGDGALIFQSLVRYGDALIFDRGRFSDGRKQFEEALSMSVANSYPVLQGVAYLDLSFVDEHCKQTRQAAVYCGKALDCFEKARDHARSLQASGELLILSCLAKDELGMEKACCDAERFARLIDVETAQQSLTTLAANLEKHECKKMSAKLIRLCKSLKQ